MTFIEKLTQRWHTSNSLLCIGIDPDPHHLQQLPLSTEQPFFDFARAIIDHTHKLVCAYKFQSACYQMAGREQELLRSIHYLQQHYPQIPIILDAKRGDIAISAHHYAREVFDRYRADAVTVNPYLGGDSLQPFLDYHDRGVIIVCKTSNPGSEDFQGLLVDGQPLYEKVAITASQLWNKNGNCLLVVGGTWPGELGNLRRKLPNMPFLVPGLGDQGADLQALLQAGLNDVGSGIIISSSRQIIYANSGPQFALAAQKKSETINNNINELRKNFMKQL